MSTPTRRRIPTFVKVLGAVAVVVVVLAGFGIWWFFKDDAPEAVNLQTAVDQVQGSTTTESGAGTSAAGDAPTTTTGSSAPSADGGVNGAWTVDTTSGEFDFESATGTFAGFRISENLAGIGSTTAVGRTGDVSGTVTIDGTTVTAATFEVDFTTITTNERRRDDRVQQALETGTFPTGSFTLTAPIDLGAGAASGEAVSVTATGDLTIHGVTKSVSIPIDAQLVNGTIVLVGSVDLTFADYGVSVPSSPVVLSVDDHGILEMQILLVQS